MSDVVKYYVVQPFAVGHRGRIVPSEPKLAPNEETALRWMHRHDIAIAFYRIGDPSTGEWDDAVVIAQAGCVPGLALTGLAA